MSLFKVVGRSSSIATEGNCSSSDAGIVMVEGGRPDISSDSAREEPTNPTDSCQHSEVPDDAADAEVECLTSSSIDGACPSAASSTAGRTSAAEADLSRQTPADGENTEATPAGAVADEVNCAYD